jgi:RNA polymerase sigma factor (sigma-70 family)
MGLRARKGGAVTHSHATIVDVPRLVRSAQAGDAAARDELITGHLPLIYNIVGRALNGHPDVDDLVQDTMLRAIRGLPALREPDRFRSWLVAIAYRQIQLHLRSRSSARLRRAPELADVPDPVGDFAERTTAEMVVADQRRELAEAARWLDDDDRRLLGLWWQEASGELTRTELAAALAVQPKHAAVRVQRMKSQLDAARGIVRALRARPRCPALADQLRRWNGIADPLWRKRFVRHVRECPLCAPRGQGLVAPEELLLGMAALPVPAGVLTGVLGQAALPGKLGLGAFLQHKVLVVAATTTVAAGGIAYAVYQTPAPDTVTLPTPTPTVRSAAPGVVATRSAAAPSPSPTAREIVGMGVRSADLYVAPNGSDDGDGSAASPLATVAKAVALVRPGQTIALRGGTYRPTAPITITTDGTATKRILLSNYRDEQPVIDAAGIPADQWAITQQSAYWTVQGLEVQNSKSHAYVCRACHDDVFQRLSMHGNARSGLLLRDDGTSGNTVLDSDFYDNGSGTAGVGVGLGVQFGAGGGNLLRGNRAYGNAAAGFDLGSFRSAVTVEYNWAYRNGNGFVLGGGTPAAVAAHKLRHDAAWDNDNQGFTDEGNTAALQLTDNTAFRNGGTGFTLPYAAATVRSNVSIDNGTPADLAPGASASRNSWQTTGATFRSTDPAEAEGPRTAAGRLPGTAFLTTGNGTGASMAGS